MSLVTVIMNAYKRPHTLIEQYNAIKNQTVEDISMMCWFNSSEELMNFQHSEEFLTNVMCAFSNANLGVWARFAYALNAKTKYVCVVDDDTIFGNKWIENCLNTMSTHRGLLGCRGVRMTGDDHLNYPGCSYEGICGNNNIEQVDVMGHCWFFEKDWLRYYWAEAPSNLPLYGGEDMHFSYAIQKHLDLNTYVPAQPDNDKEMWGSINPSKYGEDMVATSRTRNGHVQANAYWNHILSQGYKLVKDQK
jgi:glycosyltransferase involved in cell wall biosynthesis